MVAWRLRSLVPDGRELLIAAGAAVATALVALAGIHKLGFAGLLAPLGLVALLAMLRKPLAMLSFVVGLIVLFEGADFGLFHFTAVLYTSATVVNMLVALVVLSVCLDLLRKRRQPRVPTALAVPLGILVLAMVVGIATGHAAGVSLSKAMHSENLLDYLVFLPIAVANLDIDTRQVSRLLQGAFGLAIIKAVLGLVEVGSGHGAAIEGTGSLTYYEPTANWLILLALLGIFTALVGRIRPPLWMLLGSPLLLASLVLSYRRSFWIAAVLGLALVLLLALSPTGRRLLVPACLLIALAVWLLGSIKLESQSPLVARATSLAPTKLEANLEDRYRLDERANVFAEIEKNPITGLGIFVEWRATHQGLPVEHEGGRGYVHFAALWYWLKLGILGLIAYIALILASALLAWRVWHRSRAPLFRAFGLASLCGLAGLLVMETTASFTGVDTRFTVLIAAQIGLLALLARIADVNEDAPAANPSAARASLQ
jgi:O-antigen ligase